MQALAARTRFAKSLAVVLLCCASSILNAADKYLLNGEELRHVERWKQISNALFPGQEIIPGDDFLELTAPVTPKDPALVPVIIKANYPQTAERFIKKISLLIDHNPAPLAAVFHLTPRSGKAHLKTRVRVNEFSFITVVAETNDGETFMTRKFVRASGGCDSPPRVDTEAIMSRLGKMRLLLPGTAAIGRSSPADLQIMHPNYNGMQVGNTAGVYIPPRLVQSVEVSFADEPLLTIDGHMSLSEDPKFRFYYQPDRQGDFSVKVVDSDQTEFEQSWEVKVEKPKL